MQLTRQPWSSWYGNLSINSIYPRHRHICFLRSYHEDARGERRYLPAAWLC